MRPAVGTASGPSAAAPSHPLRAADTVPAKPALAEEPLSAPTSPGAPSEALGAVVTALGTWRRARYAGNARRESSAVPWRRWRHLPSRRRPSARVAARPLGSRSQSRGRRSRSAPPGSGFPQSLRPDEGTPGGCSPLSPDLVFPGPLGADLRPSRAPPAGAGPRLNR